MANRNKKSSLEDCYEYFELERKIEVIFKGWDEIFLDVTGIDVHKCPVCVKGNKVCREFLGSRLYRPPPEKTA